MEYTTLNHTVWEDAKNRIVDLHCFEYTGEGEILYEGDCFPIDVYKRQIRGLTTRQTPSRHKEGSW